MPVDAFSRMSASWRQFFVSVAVSLCVAAGYIFLADLAPFATLESQTLGWRFQIRGPVPSPGSVAVIALDDRTLARFNAWPLPRMVLAEAVAKADAAGAKAIGLDLLLPELEGPTDGLTPGPGDSALRRALMAANAPVLGMALTFGPPEPVAPAIVQTIDRSAFRIVSLDSKEIPALLSASGALVPAAPFRGIAELGHVNVPVDEGSALYRLPLAIGFGEVYVPAFPVVLAARHLDLSSDDVELRLGSGRGRQGPGIALGDVFIPSDSSLRLVLNYYGTIGAVPTYSLLDLLDDRLPPGALEGRTVLIGATALGVGDTFVTPFSGELPGVEALATATANMVEGDLVVRDLRTILFDILAILLLGLATFLLAQLPSPAAAVGAGLAVLAGWLVLTQLAFDHRELWLNVTFPSLAILLNASCIAVGRISSEQRLRGVVERQRQNLSRYHSPLIADLLARGDADSFGDRTQKAAILFIDMAGFTKRSAEIGPEETARFLRDFHRRVEQAVLRHSGVLEQFTGDGAMVIFGVPHPSAGDAAAALACGRELIGVVERWSDELVAAGQAAVRVGVGIHYGPVVIARLGGVEQVQLTAAGETVNLASRLEAMTRVHRAAIVVSDALVEAVRRLGRDDLLGGFEKVPPQAVRGLDHPVPVWILRLLPAAATEQRGA